MNSDSIHSLAEDAYNFSTIINFPQELQKYVSNNFKATNISLSIYHSIKTLHFLSLVFLKQILIINNSVLEKKYWIL